MGRREVAAGSASISAESSFRKLDDVFLQTQTRIWLSEVLNVSLLNEELPISDLLADGEILYEVSKVIWDMLLAKTPELRHIKYKPLHSQKSSGRFRPYSNVDSFLKICKILGLNSIDLLSPSDVVERRNARKVCICIRTVSKKARSKHLKVPDFDMVTYTVSMPKDMVGCIRRSWETSQHSVSSSSSYCSYKDHQRRKVREYDSWSEESDEAESKYNGKHHWISDRDNSPGAESRTKQRMFHSHKVNFDRVDCSPGSYASVQDSNFENEEGNYISDYLAFSDSVICGTDGNGPVLLEGEDNNIFNFFTGKDSCWSKTGQRVLDSDDTDDLEVSSTASMSSLLGRVLNLEYDDRFDLDGSLNGESHNEMLDNGVVTKYETYHKSGKVYSVDLEERCLSGFQSREMDSNNQNLAIPSISCEAVAKKLPHSLSAVKESKDDSSVPPPCTEFPNEVDGKLRDTGLVAEKVSREEDKRDDDGVSNEKVRPMPFLLHTVAGGTAIFGFMFLLLHHLRRRGDEKSDANRKPPPNKKFVGRDISYKNGRSEISKERIYPAEKLKFKN
ncbi:unnamed protein product [Cuscuta epithymum]|uniref:Calponin-homology (CH) domain-containing protein n=1 Tax=Cuscuta epithymum TaxID=186058 RepID=A0AAV0EMR1_9ASTE|nr:unnamed protein product [Cuscuta epithymum]